MPKIRTLVADDSAFMRVLISNILNESGFAEVVGIARNGKEAISKTLQLHPDVIILDVIMPIMNGLAALKEIMRKRPTPILILTALDRSHIDSILKAYTSGAVDFIQKPGGMGPTRHAPLESIKHEILTKVKLAAEAKIIPTNEYRDEFSKMEVIPDVKLLPDMADRIIVIGTSTGGPRMLPILLKRFPTTIPPILIVQHMPSEFTTYFAKSLNAQCNLHVKEAISGDKLRIGHVYVAKGGYHLRVTSRPKYTIQLTEDPPVNFVRPAVDVTLGSVAKAYGDKAVAIILTGMGVDGCNGARLIKQHGGTIIAEAKSTAIIFGMPKAVIDAGLADVVSPIYQIPLELKRWGWF